MRCLCTDRYQEEFKRYLDLISKTPDRVAPKETNESINKPVNFN